VRNFDWTEAALRMKEDRGEISNGNGLHDRFVFVLHIDSQSDIGVLRLLPAQDIAQFVRSGHSFSPDC
jgi:hypothetical protein